MIVGLTGPNCSGKTEVADYLKKKGFAYYSLSDIVRSEAQKRNVPATRENLIEIGNELRIRHGLGYLAEQLGIVSEPAVVDSIRCPEEVDVLRRRAGFILLGITAPLDVRFERSKARGRIGDGTTLEEFKQLEDEENSDKGQQLQKTLKMSSFIIVNDKTVEHLHRQIETILKHADKVL